MGLMDFLKGAGGGAATGGAIGGPWGAAIGGVAGGLLSSFGGSGSDTQDAYSRQLDQYRQQILSRGIPQLDPTQTATASGFRQNQTDLISRLEAMANGTGPSLAGQQLQQATDQNMARQQSIAQSGRGNAALANIVAANNSNNFGQQAAQQAAIQRTQEQLGATSQLGQAVGQARQSDDAMSQFNAQQQNFASQDNLKAKLQLLGLNDQAIQGIMSQQGQIASRPGMSDQLLAGGVGALGMYASQQRQNNPGYGNSNPYNPSTNRNGLMSPV